MPLAKNLIEAAGNATQANYIEDVFSTYLRAGTNTTANVVNGIDLSTKGGMVWFKARNQTGNNIVYDTVRGAAKYLYTNSTNAQNTNLSGYDLTAFNTDGYTLGTPENSGVNDSPFLNVGWTFRKQPKFFDVVTFTKSTASISVPHNLGSVPGCVIIKRTDGADEWPVYHRGLASSSNFVYLNRTYASDTAGSSWITPTSTTLEFNNVFIPADGNTYVAYIFAHDAGGFGLTGTDNVISCGSFTTDGSGNASVNLGYEPQWVMTKRTDAAGNWSMLDVMRGMTVNAGSTSNLGLYADSSSAELAGVTLAPTPKATGMDYTSVGPSRTFIYIAIRRGPMKVPTDATKVFKPIAKTGDGSTTTVTNVGFPTDLFMFKWRSLAYAWKQQDRLRGFVQQLNSSATSAEADSGTYTFGTVNNTGYTYGSNASVGTDELNYSGTTSAVYAFGRAPSFFDEVCYTGTGANRTVTHNLQAVPEMMFVFRRDSASSDRRLYSSALGNQYYMSFNQNYATQGPTAILWNNTSPTSSVFTVGTYSDVNASGGTYVAYLFATCAGVSKVGNYTGTGTTKQVDCGFAAGARFVLIKKTSGTGSWYVWDSARGIVSGNDPYLLLNSTAAEVTSTDYIDTYAAGFEISSTAPSEINENGGSFIFLAIA